MKKTILGVGIAALAALTVPLLIAPPASATEVDDTPYVLVAWQMPDDGSGWPQQWKLTEDVAVIDEGTLNLLDDELAALSGCHTYQVDIYDDNEVTQTLLDYGVLGGEGSPPESGVVTWKYFTGGADCEVAPTLVTPIVWVNDLCGTANDTYGFTPVEGIEYTQNGTFIVARALPGYVLPDASTLVNWGNWDGTIATELANLLTDVPCTIGGKTIGFWTNKVGTAAEASGGFWAQVVAAYPMQTASLSTFGKAQTFIKNATASVDGVSMLRAQFFATALNSLYIEGYGEQTFSTPIGCVTVDSYLQYVEDNWATITASKETTTAVKTVLDRINQDVPLVASQCTV